jgi:hypothetical protein
MKDVCLILLLLGTFRKWDRLLIPVWKGVLLSDSLLWVVLPPIIIIITGFCLISAALFYWQRCPVWVPLPVWVHLKNPSVSYGLLTAQSSPRKRSALSWQLTQRCHGLVLLLWMVGRSDTSFANWPTITWHPHQLYSIMFGQLHEGLVAVPDQFWGDVVAQSFNHSLAIRENIFVPIPIVTI